MVGAFLFLSWQSDRAQADRWFDALPIAAAVARPFGRVGKPGPEDREGFRDFGFRDGKDARGLDLTPIGVAGWRPIDFAAWASRRLAESRKPYHEDMAIRDRRTLYVISRACAVRGLTKLSDAFFKASREAFSYNEKGKPFLPLLQTDLSQPLLGAVIGDLGNPKIPRANFAPRFACLAADFPLAENAAWARAMAARIEAMLPEDAAHGPLDERRLAAMPVDERVGELVFRLRDQHSEQWSEPGDIELFFDLPESNVKKPAARLAKIGLPAVPRLIEALGDRTPTRSVYGGLRRRGTNQVFSVGDAAVRILERIAHRGFSPPNGVADEAKATLAVKKEAWAWWREVQAKGEERVLVEAVRSGKGRWDAATRLAEAYPASATGAVAEAVRRSEEEGDRSYLIQTLARVHRPETRAFARDQMLRGRGVAARVAGAEIVAQTDPEGATAAMIALWRMTHGEPCGAIVGFLVGSGRPDAAAALAKGLRARPLEDRLSVVDAFATGTVPDPFARGAFRRLIERMLVEELEDLEERTRMSMSSNDFSFEHPFLGDLAAFALYRCFPERYAFRQVYSDLERGRIRAEARNAWRRGRGLRPLPLPKVAAVPPRLAALLRDPARRDDARRLAVTVREARVVGAPRMAALQAAVRRLRGRPLTADAFVGLLDLATRHWPRGAAEVAIAAQRDVDGRGILLSVQIRARPKAGKIPDMVDESFFVQAGSNTLYNGSGGASIAASPSPEDWKDDHRAIHDALLAAPLAPLRIEYRFRLSDAP